MISPGLFDIYTESIIEKLNSIVIESENIFMYADLALIADRENMKDAIIDLCRKLNFIKCSCDSKSIITINHLYSHHQVKIDLDDEVNFWLDETKHTSHAETQEKIEKLTATLNLVKSLSGGPPL